MKTILFYGDSITDARHLKENDDNFAGHGYATMVKGLLGAECPGEYTFLNRGVAGDRVRDLFCRVRRDVLNLKPDYMSILIGVNDVWHELNHQNGNSEARFEQIYGYLLDEILQELPDVRIMLMEPFVLRGWATVPSQEHPEPDRWECFRGEVERRAAAAKRVAQRYGLPFVPLQKMFDEACNAAPADYWLFDGVHPTAMGHELIKREWLKAFARMTGTKSLV